MTRVAKACTKAGTTGIAVPPCSVHRMSATAFSSNWAGRPAGAERSLTACTGWDQRLVFGRKERSLAGQVQRERPAASYPSYSSKEGVRKGQRRCARYRDRKPE